MCVDVVPQWDERWLTVCDLIVAAEASHAETLAALERRMGLLHSLMNETLKMLTRIEAAMTSPELAQMKQYLDKLPPTAAGGPRTESITTPTCETTESEG